MLMNKFKFYRFHLPQTLPDLFLHILILAERPKMYNFRLVTPLFQKQQIHILKPSSYVSIVLLNNIGHFHLFLLY